MKADSGKALPNVINNLTSVSTTDALSAAQWKALKDALDNISWLWKFLSLWDSATWQPISFPLSTPYTYTTWDRFLVEVVWTTNYKPNGSSYTWTASTTVESWTVAQWDVYIYDWTNWLLQKNADISVSFSSLAWQPTDNTALAAALNAKQDTLTAGTGISIASNTVSTSSNFWKSTTAAATVQKEVSIPWIKELHEGQVVHILPSVTSTVANSTLKVNNFTAYPMRYNNAAITTSTDSIVRPANIVTTFVFDGTYWQFVWHGLDSNTTYSNMSATEANTWTATSARTISASILKWAIQTHAPVQSVNWQTWAVTLTIPTVNNATLTIQKNWTNVQTFTANQSTNATANITVPTDTADLTNWAWYLTSSTWVTTVNGSHWAVTVQATISDLSTIRTNATNWATVVSGDSGVTYTIKVSNSDPTSWTASNIITLVP